MKHGVIDEHTTISTPAERAAMLPAPKVGKIITISIELWLEYLRIHGLEVVGGDKVKGVVICQRAAEAKA